MQQKSENKLVIRRPELKKLTGLCNSTHHNLSNKNSKYFDPEFPRAIQLTKGGSVGWLYQEVLAWIDSRTAKSRTEGGKSTN
ncbi:MAG: hypothetical protein RLY95_1135 [Pseudomonadota bacterium]|jgi:predicted DNA-binding transcriptional regulator AlpA